MASILILDQKGSGPSKPRSRSVQRAIEIPVVVMRMRRDRRCHSVTELWLTCRYQPRPRIHAFKTSRGQVSTRNSGAAASPAPPAPRRPSTAGRIHHQGSGDNVPIGANRPSIFKNRNILFSLFPDHRNHCRRHRQHCSRWPTIVTGSAPVNDLISSGDIQTYSTTNVPMAASAPLRMGNSPSAFGINSKVITLPFIILSSFAL